MRILVISDTHGETDRVYKIIKKLQVDGPIDMIAHCGDLESDALEISRICGIPAVMAKGNCDGCFEENFSLLDTEAGRFLVTHGHMENVGFSQQNLYYRAEEEECLGVLYGHTHRAVFTKAGDIYLMNPGSLTRPRDGSGGTFGLLITSPGSIWGKIYDYEDFINQKSGGNPAGVPASKVRGGHLRELINYSDRF